MNNPIMNWQATGVILTVVGLMVTASTAYLRLFTKNMIMDWSETFEQKVKAEVDLIVNLKLQVIQQQLDHHERAIDRLEFKKVTKLSP